MLILLTEDNPVRALKLHYNEKKGIIIFVCYNRILTIIKFHVMKHNELNKNSNKLLKIAE